MKTMKYKSKKVKQKENHLMENKAKDLMALIKSILKFKHRQQRNDQDVLEN